MRTIRILLLSIFIALCFPTALLSEIKPDHLLFGDDDLNDRITKIISVEFFQKRTLHIQPGYCRAEGLCQKKGLFLGFQCVPCRQCK